jgi:hypothetical protein
MEIRYVSQIPSATIQTLLQESTQWIQRLMLHSHGVRMASVSLDHDMVVDVDIQPLSAGILAGARPTVWNTTVTPAMPVRQSVTLNANELVAGGSLLMPCMLNGQYMVKLIPVMIHEMLHGLGIASLPSTADTVGWGSFLDASRTWYVGHQGNATGSKAIQAYQAWTGSMELHRIPVENSFGQGTAYSHWEEGMRDGFVSETRTYDEGKGLGMMVYPALPNELMTGVAGSIFYLTPLTLGALADYGYPVKDDSDAVVMYPK